MKKIITSILICISFAATAQKSQPLTPTDKHVIDYLLKQKDSVVVITISREQMQGLINSINANIDSKKASADLINFLISNAALVPKKEK